MNEEVFLNQVREFLEGLVGDAADGLTAESELIASGLLDSLSLLDYVAFLEKLRGAPLQPDEISLQSLSTIRSSYELVEGVRAGQGAG